METPTILVAEDNEAFQLVLQETLEAEGWNVITVKTGEEALTVAQEKRPNLIFLDILLDGKSGNNVLKELRADQGWGANVPIIVITSMTYLEDMQEIRQLSTEFIYKGDFELADIPVTVRRLLNIETSNSSNNSKDDSVNTTDKEE